ncbi:AlwI family type II restriction endonuclease [Sedimentibacter sp.]|uniref:AlwI family type II restriction endonuclease n=1 Tax=Sedimentibacter sp. TaxID=1960295 RepID=UPI00289B8CD2|nr:AlwI family type II restriction endonuclease [Sedimentibacter sp.]
MTRRAYHKPLSFSTTMRSPNRIADFLNCILPFEGRTLTNELIMEIVKRIIGQRLYTPYYVNRTPRIKSVVIESDENIPGEMIDEIIRNSPQNHKEAGFDKGWPSRFDTWYKLPMEFGYVAYSIGQPLRISQTGHMLIDAVNEIPVNENKIQAVLLNSMMKYQVNNPFRKNSNNNIPLVLLLQVINLLKNDPEENDAGVFRKELSLFICWPNNDYRALYNRIKRLRESHRFNYSDEYMYDICLELLGATDEDRNRFKMSQICGELVDEYIRKMRSTGIISFRGNGRFLDFNMFEIEKINYILENYNVYTIYTNKQEYFNYMGAIDENILNIERVETTDVDEIRMNTLMRFARDYTRDSIANELTILGMRRDSRDGVLRYIPETTRLEFLTSIALIQNFEGLDVRPNYIIDDEGLPTSTALGGMADIVCYDVEYDSLVEVSLMNGRQQVNNEMLPITRHVKDAKENNENTFAVFVAPSIHDDVRRYTRWIKADEEIDIIAYDIETFIATLNEKEKLQDLLVIS